MSAAPVKKAQIPVTEMVAHVKDIAEKNNIILRLESPDKCKAYTTARPMRVISRPITSAYNYLVTLHELGHCLDTEALRLSKERGNQLVCETLAWAWALKVSKVTLDDKTKYRIGDALRSYREHWHSVADASRGTLSVNLPPEESRYLEIIGWKKPVKTKERFLP